jgi:hypothetical protein
MLAILHASPSFRGVDHSTVQIAIQNADLPSLLVLLHVGHSRVSRELAFLAAQKGRGLFDAVMDALMRQGLDDSDAK